MGRLFVVTASVPNTWWIYCNKEVSIALTFTTALECKSIGDSYGTCLILEHMNIGHHNKSYLIKAFA